MKTLLTAINAKYIHSNPAIYSLKSYAGRELQRHIALAEYTINNKMEEILGDLYRRQPDVIGFSCYIWNWRLVQELLRELPKVLPGTELWLGGPEVSFDAVKIVKTIRFLRPEIKNAAFVPRSLANLLYQELRFLNSSNPFFKNS